MRRLLSCLLLCLLPLLAQAVEPPRPKIGLVLSGGAARGLAHIGVLKALEEQGIHIDAIAGTSMGAVIGGLYASGYKIDELEKLALNIDWKLALSDAPPREDVPFRRKQDDRDFLVKQKLSFRDDGSLGLPLGVIQGQNLALLLESMFAHRSDTRDFDKLPIPFRAVATDITSGEKVVFRKGHLPQVIRASMSIPAVFAPVELDGRLLVDGGMTDNIPLDVAREMGVDIAIVVDIGTPLRSRKQLNTVVDVLNQSITLMTRRNSEEQLKALHASDVLIQPPLAAYGVTDFGRATDMIDAGYRATRAWTPAWRACALPDRWMANWPPPVRRASATRWSLQSRSKTTPRSVTTSSVITSASPSASHWTWAACKPTWAPCTAWTISSRCNIEWLKKARTTPW